MVPSNDQVIATIVANSGSAADLGHLHSQLKGYIPSISNNPQKLYNLAVGLDSVLHGLGLLHILEALSKCVAQGDPIFIDITSKFLLLCPSNQIQMSPDLATHLTRRYKEHVISAGCPRIGVAPLLAMLRKVQPTPEHLTPIHADFLQLCLLSKVYNAATGLLSDDIFDVDPHKTCSTPTDFFLYCYYGGMVAAGNKLYSRALELLQQAVTAPAPVAPSAIVVAAYKKLVLVSLIHSGSMVQLPKYTSTRVKSVAESDGKPYTELAGAYGTHLADKLNKCIEQHSAAYALDNNLGLVRQVAASLVNRNIQRLTQTYLTLSLGDIASNVGLASAEEAEMHVLRMIESGDVHARIDEHDGMVRFLEDPEQYKDEATVLRVDAQIRRSVQIAARMKAVHEAVMCDKAYLSKVSAKERSRYEQPQEDYGPTQMMFQP